MEFFKNLFKKKEKIKPVVSDEAKEAFAKIVLEQKKNTNQKKLVKYKDTLLK